MRLTRAQRAQRGAKNRAAAKQRRDGTFHHFTRSVDQLVRDCETHHRKLERTLPALRPAPTSSRVLGTVVTTLAALVGEDEALQRAMGLEDGVEGLIDKIASGDFPPPMVLPARDGGESEES